MRSVSFRTIDHPRYRYQLTMAYMYGLRYGDIDVTAEIPGDATHLTGYWVKLERGVIWIARGYAWDGPSGPAIDTMGMARGSLVHDAGYQLIAAGALPLKPWKKYFDQEFRSILKQDGVGWFRRNYAYAAVRLFGRGRDKFRPDNLPGVS